MTNDSRVLTVTWARAVVELSDVVATISCLMSEALTAAKATAGRFKDMSVLTTGQMVAAATATVFISKSFVPLVHGVVLPMASVATIAWQLGARGIRATSPPPHTPSDVDVHCDGCRCSRVNCVPEHILT